MREIRMLRTTWRELETELRDELRHRQMAKADGNSYSPCLRPPRLLSTLPDGEGLETGPWNRLRHRHEAKAAGKPLLPGPTATAPVLYPTAHIRLAAQGPPP